MNAAALVLAALVLVAGGVGWLWLKAHPYGKCRWCGGSGRNPLSVKARFGECKHCKGSGRKQWKV